MNSPKHSDQNPGSTTASFLSPPKNSPHAQSTSRTEDLFSIPVVAGTTPAFGPTRPKHPKTKSTPFDVQVSLKKKQKDEAITERRGRASRSSTSRTTSPSPARRTDMETDFPTNDKDSEQREILETPRAHRTRNLLATQDAEDFCSLAQRLISLTDSLSAHCPTSQVPSVNKYAEELFETLAQVLGKAQQKEDKNDLQKLVLSLSTLGLCTVQ
ncbi:hypothetical protein D9758_003417 [Tetrapyrgos nigripes]|uniref:Uncharacterized protein n=1 Tax=Tetrapyrgos nigripes TaxID=182062 RepID=A0A8H5GV74_9AGAR|nr:hypothetical protein D9758_003417 [Tetrapyrgos nigripes]